MSTERASEEPAAAPLPYADDFPRDAPETGLSIPSWCSPKAELAALLAVGDYNVSPAGTDDEKRKNLALYLEARRLFAEGIGMKVWVNGSLNRRTDIAFLGFLDDFRGRVPSEVKGRIAALRQRIDCRQGVGAAVVQAVLITAE